MTLSTLFFPADPERSRFLLALFMSFAADIVRCWAADSHAPYRDLGKPVLRSTGAARGVPLDFAFQDRRKQQVYGVVMFCDPLHELPLKAPEQLEPLRSARTFSSFLDAAANPAAYRLSVSGSEHTLGGAILIWSSLDSKKARAAIRKTHALTDVLALDQIIRDLLEWQNRDFQLLIDRRAAWCYDFFRGLRQLK
jgi:hypothetical protein